MWLWTLRREGAEHLGLLQPHQRQSVQRWEWRCCLRLVSQIWRGHQIDANIGSAYISRHLFILFKSKFYFRRHTTDFRFRGLASFPMAPRRLWIRKDWTSTTNSSMLCWRPKLFPWRPSTTGICHKHCRRKEGGPTLKLPITSTIMLTSVSVHLGIG
jgi:hypothetical protein